MVGHKQGLIAIGEKALANDQYDKALQAFEAAAKLE